MSELLRAAILGTGQGGDPVSERSESPADTLIDALGELPRERALLLRAGAHALLRRAGRVLPRRSPSLPLAAAESLRASSPPLTDALRMLFESDEDLLAEALERMARARVRLAPELLPLALEQTEPELRARLKPVLGARGAWLAAQRPEWTWALDAASGAALPSDFELRWSEGNAAERRGLFTLARKLSPAHARELAVDAFPHEKADQRAAFAEAFAIGLGADDEPFLSGLLSDRSAVVQKAAARVLWRLPGSALAQRMLERARAHVRYEPSAARWHVRLPAEPLDPSWEREGIREVPPGTRQLGQRQWWTLQLMAAVPCASWLPDGDSDPQLLVAAARKHEHAAILLDGLTQSALMRGERAWFAPLWDAWAASDLTSTLTSEPRAALGAQLTPEEITARAAQLVADDRLRPLLSHLPRPWPEALALRVLAGISDLRLSLRDAIPVAALGIPVELLPDSIPLPDSGQVEYPLRAFVRALEHFQQVAALRRSIAAETVP